MREIELGHGIVTLVDDEDYEELNKYSWFAHRDRHTYYALRSRGKTNICMHREILSVLPGIDVDHKDGDGLNNQRDNIRICTKAQNAANQKPQIGRTSRYKGISWSRPNRKWLAGIKVDGHSIYLGLYRSENEAALVYNEAAFKYFGEFARPNVIAGVTRQDLRMMAENLLDMVERMGPEAKFMVEEKLAILEEKES